MAMNDQGADTDVPPKDQLKDTKKADESVRIQILWCPKKKLKRDKYAQSVVNIFPDDYVKIWYASGLRLPNVNWELHNVVVSIIVNEKNL